MEYHMLKWEDYKLGDAIKGWNRKGLTMPFIDYCCLKFPGSIVCDYRRRTSRFNQYATLAEVAKTRANLYHFHEKGCLSLPSPNETVVHLRLGDVVAGTLPNHYVYRLEHYRALIGQNLTIVTNPYRTRQTGKDGQYLTDRSHEYVRNLTKYLKRGTNQEIQYRSCLPDEDFVYMTHARHFVQAGGGYSHIVHETNKILRKGLLS